MIGRLRMLAPLMFFVMGCLFRPWGVGVRDELVGVVDI